MEQKQEKQERHQENHTVDIAIRVLQYPLALLRPQSQPYRIEYHTKTEKITYTASECITTEDLEKLFAAIYCGRNAYYATLEGHEVVVTQCSLFGMRRLTKLHDYQAVVKSLRKFTSITIEIEEIGQGKKTSSGFLYRVEYPEKTDDTKTIQVIFHRRFYEACKRGLTLNLDTYTRLSPIAKNIYCVIISHCSHSVFSESFLFERSLIGATQTYKARQILKKALQEITHEGIIRSFSCFRKGKKYIYHIVRKGKKKKKNQR